MKSKSEEQQKDQPLSWEMENADKFDDLDCRPVSNYPKKNQEEISRYLDQRGKEQED